MACSAAVAGPYERLDALVPAALLLQIEESERFHDGRFPARDSGR